MPDCWVVLDFGSGTEAYSPATSSLLAGTGCLEWLPVTTSVLVMAAVSVRVLFYMVKSFFLGLTINILSFRRLGGGTLYGRSGV